MFPPGTFQTTLFFITEAGEDGGDGETIPLFFFLVALVRGAFFLFGLLTFLGGCFETSSGSVLTTRRFFNGRFGFLGNDILLVASGILFCCCCRGPETDCEMVSRLEISMASSFRK